jgi:hypothetical protein
MYLYAVASLHTNSFSKFPTAPHETKMASPVTSHTTTATMMSTLDDMKQELGDGNYLRLTTQLGEIRNATPVLYRLTYRHVHTVSFTNPDYASESRLFSSDHRQLCEVVAIAGDCLYRQIHHECAISKPTADAIQRKLRNPGYATYTRKSPDDVGDVREIFIVRCERV